MNKNIRKKLAKIAAKLDEKKLFKLADEIDELLSEDPDEEDRRHDEMLENYIPHTPTDEAQESVALIEEHIENTINELARASSHQEQKELNETLTLHLKKLDKAKSGLSHSKNVTMVRDYERMSPARQSQRDRADAEEDRINMYRNEY